MKEIEEFWTIDDIMDVIEAQWIINDIQLKQIDALGQKQSDISLRIPRMHRIRRR